MHQVKQTADGSTTIYLPHLNEHYHSVHGAVNESMHVFIKNGFDALHKQPDQQINLLEIGFGTGLNALLTLRAAEQQQALVYYHTLEPFPLAKEIYGQLNYTLLPGLEQYHAVFDHLHTSACSQDIACSDLFTLHKSQTTLEEIQLTRQYDLIYFDAFGPRVQPEIWSLHNFEKLFAAMKPGAILVTYCSKGDVRRNMMQAGFLVEKLPGPPGKREMVRALRATGL